MAEHTKKGSGTLAKAAGTMGKSGGPARAKVLSRSKRSAIAREGAYAKNRGTAHQRGRTGGKKK